MLDLNINFSIVVVVFVVPLIRFKHQVKQGKKGNISS